MMIALTDGILWIFGGDSPQHPLALGQVAMRAAVVYFIGLVIVRVGKSRLLSRASAIDVILGFVLGSLLSRGITGSASITSTTIACATLIAMHFILTAWGCSNHRIGVMFKGSERLLVEDGEVNMQNMHISHISYNDLMEELRLNANCNDISQVQVAYKERSGQVGVVLQKKPPRIVDISVADGIKTVRLEL